jgi:hypothetical protein
VALIRRGFAASLSSRVIADLLPLLEAACVPRSRALLDAERQRLEAQIAAMTQARVHLEEVIAIAADPTWRCDTSTPVRPGPAAARLGDPVARSSGCA